MLQPKKPLDLSGANKILEERKPLDLSGAESILKKKESSKSTIPTESLDLAQLNGSSAGQNTELKKFTGLSGADLKSLESGEKPLPKINKSIQKQLYDVDEVANRKEYQQKAIKKYRENTKLSDEEKEETKKDLLAKENQEGIWNNIKAVSKNVANKASDLIFRMTDEGSTPEDLKIDTDPFSDEKKQAREYFASEGVQSPKKVDIDAKAKEIYVDNVNLEKKQQKINSYLKDVSPETKSLLKIDADERFKSLSKEKKDATNRININQKYFDELSDALEDPDITEKDKAELAKERIKIAKYIDSDYKYFTKKDQELGTAQDEFEAFKRNYNAFDNFISRAGYSLADAGISFYSGANYLANMLGANEEYKQEAVQKGKEYIDSERDRFRPNNKDLTLDNFFQYSTDLLANQTGTLAQIATGGTGGVVALGVEGAGDTYSKMQLDQKNGAKYTPEQMAIAPFVSGLSTAILSELPTVSTLKNSANVWLSAMKGTAGRELINTAVKNTSKSIIQNIAKETGKEVATESMDNIVQNAIRRDILGDKTIGYFDNTLKTIKDTALLTGMIGGVGAMPHVAMSAVKTFSDKESTRQLDINAKKIRTLLGQLDNPDISETTKKVIKEQIDIATKESSENVNKTIDKIGKMPISQIETVYNNSKRISEIQQEAIDIKEDSGLEDVAKKTLLTGLEQEYRALEETNTDIINSEIKPELATSPLKKELVRINAPEKLIEAINDDIELKRPFIVNTGNVLESLLTSGMYSYDGLGEKTKESIEVGELSNYFNKAKKDRTLLHEAVHAATSLLYDDIERNPQKYTKNQNESFSKLKNTIDNYINNTSRLAKETQKLYGLTNVHEFMAEFISNKKFRDYIGKTSEDKKVSTVNYIWNEILDLLGVNKNKIDQNKLNDISSSIDDIFDTTKDYNNKRKEYTEKIKQNESNEVKPETVTTNTAQAKPQAEVQEPTNEAGESTVFLEDKPNENKKLVLFHGTPHAFESFKTNKIGSGEGNQAFGAGLYFTNSKSIAENYANNISTKQKFWEYLMDGNDISLTKKQYNFLNDQLDNLGFDGYNAENANVTNLKVDGEDIYNPAVYDALSALFTKKTSSQLKEDFDLSDKEYDKLQEIKKTITNPQLYEIEVKNDKNFLEWREEISSELASKIGSDYNTSGKNGMDIYNEIKKSLGGQEEASAYLLSKGIQGITYKSNEGTGGKDGRGRNYVIFDENNIKINKINENLQDADIDANAGVRTGTKPLDEVRVTEQESVVEEPVSKATEPRASETETKVDEEKPTALKNADIAKKRKELGLEEREKVTRKKGDELVQSATKKINDGFDVDELIDDILDSKSGKTLSDEEVVILKQYQLAKENRLIEIGEEIVSATNEGKGNSKLNKLIEEREGLVNDIDKAYRAGEQSGTITARALQARRLAMLQDYSLANMLIQKRKAIGDQKLSPEQIQEVSAEYAKIKKLREELEQKIKDLEKEKSDLKAGTNIEKLAREERKSKRKEKTEKIDTDIKSTVESLRKKLREQAGRLSANAIPIEMIPDIAKLAQLYVKKGIVKLDDIVDEIYTTLKEDISNLTKEDVKDIIGSYNYDLDTENEKRLAGFKKRTLQKIQELKEKLSTQDFEKKQNTPVKLDEDAKKLKDELRDAKYAWDKALEKDFLERRTDLEKSRDSATEILSLPRSLMASIDFSAPLRQGLVMTVNHPVIASKAFVEMFRQALSQNRFDRWLEDLKETPQYQVMKDSGLYIADTHTAKLSAREEQFMSNLANKIPIIGKGFEATVAGKKVKVGGLDLIGGSERAYVSYLNKLRTDVFAKTADAFEKDGLTIQNKPELYKALGNYINSATGRGNLGSLNDSAGILNSMFFSPRLIASRINLLTNWANPVWYANTPAKVRQMYALDMAKLVGVGTTLLALASLAGADVEKDPRSTDFGKIRIGDRRWDIWGGFQQFARFFSQMITGQKKSGSTGQIKNLGEGFNSDTRADVFINMVRSKLAPVPATLWNLADGKNMVGEEYGLKDVPKSFLPLFASDLYKAMERDGATKGVLETGIPAVFGVGVQTYSTKPSESGGKYEKARGPKPPSPPKP